MNNQIDIEAVEAQAAENAYKELWEAIKVVYSMPSHERAEIGLPNSFADMLYKQYDYRDVIIKAQKYRECRGILKSTHERMMKDLISLYGAAALQAAIKRIQEEKEQ